MSSIKKVFLFLFVSSCLLISQQYRVDMSKIKDGKYEGEYRKMVVHVVVSNNKMTTITLVKDPSMGFAKKEANEAFKKMIDKNDVEADAKTSATLKSVVYNALQNNKQVK